ncbi:hypothetical protein GBAR_LOCUS1297 [Geodia barretti]|uniref:Uncharacterized protein n=1 Tax=Geodia barretti TaxID=519541 RepID=A0AA35VV26_GEOBA|nr:hypothetical protein GBAR_LOCUS1297 [Geodia barretti]
MMQDDERWRSLSLGAETIMLKNMAGGVDERSPLCINVPPEDDVSSEFTPQQTSRLPVPPRSRGRRSTDSFTNPGATTAVLLGDDSVERGLESSYRRLSGRKGAGYDGYADQQLTSSLELSTSSNEFVSIQGSDVTTQALELCEKWALKHYRRVLVALGWIPPQSDCCAPRLRKAIHVVLVLFWMLVIVGAFIAQILSCFRRDKFLAFHDSHTWRVYNESCHDLNNGINSLRIIPADDAKDYNTTCRTLYCDHKHLFTDYILFDVLLLVVYVYGVYLFRLFCISGCLWILVSLVIRILTIFSAHLMDNSVVIKWNSEIFYEAEKVVLVVFSLVGFLFFDMVYVATAMNHAVQSELLVWLDILECRRYLRTLNGRAATSVALIIFIVGNMAILAGLTLNKMNDYDEDDAFKLTVAVLNIITWFSLVSLPIIQATRVTRACHILKDTATEIRSRPLLYTNTPQLELDSLLLLTHCVRLRATLFGVPMTPPLVYGAVAMATFVAVLLSQWDDFFLSAL